MFGCQGGGYTCFWPLTSLVYVTSGRQRTNFFVRARTYRFLCSSPPLPLSNFCLATRDETLGTVYRKIASIWEISAIIFLRGFPQRNEIRYDTRIYIPHHQPVRKTERRERVVMSQQIAGVAPMTLFVQRTACRAFLSSCVLLPPLFFPGIFPSRPLLSSSSPATRLSCRWLLFTRHSWTRRRFLCSGLFRTTRRYGPLYVIVVVLAARFRALGFGRRHIIYMVWMPSSAPTALVQSQYCRTTTVGLWLKLLPPTSFWY